MATKKQRRELAGALGVQLEQQLEGYRLDVDRGQLVRRAGEVEHRIEVSVLPLHGGTSAELLLFVRHDRVEELRNRANPPARADEKGRVRAVDPATTVTVSQTLVNLDRRCSRACSHRHGITSWGLDRGAIPMSQEEWLRHVGASMATQARAWGLPWFERVSDPQRLLRDMEAEPTTAAASPSLFADAPWAMVALTLHRLLDGDGWRDHAPRLRSRAVRNLTAAGARALEREWERLVETLEAA